MGLQNVIYRKPVYSASRSAYSLDSLYDHGSESFRLIDRDNVTFNLRPGAECRKDTVVIMALSAPRNTKKRELLRYLFFICTDRKGQNKYQKEKVMQMGVFKFI
jgi:hypothetical protein